MWGGGGDLRFGGVLVLVGLLGGGGGGCEGGGLIGLWGDGCGLGWGGFWGWLGWGKLRG